METFRKIQNEVYIRRKMPTICAFCLSNDRNLDTINKKYWKILDSCLSNAEDGQLQYLKRLQSKQPLRICWECSAKLKNLHQFISTSQQSVRLLNSYLEATTQTLPATTSKLFRTHIEILDTGPKCEETEVEDVLDTDTGLNHDGTETRYMTDTEADDDVKDTVNTRPIFEETETEDVTETLHVEVENNQLEGLEDSQTQNNAANESIIKFETTSPSDDECIINFVEPAGDDDDNDDDDIIEMSLIEEQLPPEIEPSKANDENITSKLKDKGKPPKFTVLWVSKEQAQAWYTSEREQERAASPTFTHLCDKCQRGFPSEQDLQTHVGLRHSETAGIYICHMCQYRFEKERFCRNHLESHFLLYKCKKCSHETRTPGQMQAHCRTEHVDEEVQRRNQELNNKEDQKAGTCTRCKDEFASPSELNAHLSSCTIYKCSECDASYGNYHSYNFHLKTHPEVNSEGTRVTDDNEDTHDVHSEEFTDCDTLETFDINNEVNEEEKRLASCTVIAQDVDTEVPKNQENSRQKRRVWDRKNACIYCGRLVTNFSRHLIRHHSTESEVLRFKAISDPDPKVQKLKRQAITEKLRNKGNFKHNSRVAFEKEGELLPFKRNISTPCSPSKVATCKICLGTYRRTTFHKHLKKCVSNNSEAENDWLGSNTNRDLRTSTISIVPLAAEASKGLTENILPWLRMDKVSTIVQGDPLILAFGSRLIKKKQGSRKYIFSRMRDLVTLLKIVKEKDKDIKKLKDIIEPEKYETFMESVKTMCGLNEETGFVDTNSVPARIRSAIIGCMDILYTEMITSHIHSSEYKVDYIKKLEDFKDLLATNWHWEISSNIEMTRKIQNMTKECVPPLDEDKEKVTKNNHELEDNFYKNSVKDISVIDDEITVIDDEIGVIDNETLCEATIVKLNSKMQDIETRNIGMKIKTFILEKDKSKIKNLNKKKFSETVEHEQRLENDFGKRKKPDLERNSLSSTEKEICAFDYEDTHVSEYEDSEIVLKKSDLSLDKSERISGTKTIRCKVSRTKWTNEEINAVVAHFKENIDRKINPGKAKCEAIRKKVPILQKRTWMQLNTYVNNLYKKKTKIASVALKRG